MERGDGPTSGGGAGSTRPDGAAAVATAYLGLGGNLGDRLANLRAALAALAGLGHLVALSSVYETAPWGDPDQPPYLNLCCALATDRTPAELLRRAKEIEWDLGRRPGRRWGPRPVDVDLLLYDREVIVTPELVVPHPRMGERVFVLAPLAEIAPDLRPPGQERSIAELLSALPDASRLARPVAPASSVRPPAGGTRPGLP